MTRFQFLDSQWQPYPVYTESLRSWQQGRVTGLSNNKLTLHYQNQSTTVVPVTMGGGQHPSLGLSMPLSLLVLGDVVTVSPEGQIFLLSPNLEGTRSNKAFQTSLEKNQKWFEFERCVEINFRELGYTQVRTPALVASPGVDHHIDFLEVKGTATQRAWTLPTSPEIHLKKLLCRGFDKIFEIKTSFRDDPSTPVHQVEFVMLEWYKALGTFEDLEADLKALLVTLEVEYPQLKDLPLQRVTVSELFQRILEKELTPDTSLTTLKHWAGELGLEAASDDSWNDVFFRIFLEKIEPQLGRDGFELVTDWPREQASLARVSDQGWALRMEVYWKGVELGNAYVEENAPEANAKVFEAEEALRRDAGKTLAPKDLEFFEALKLGMPPAVGMAFGLDRFFQALLQAPTLGETRFFPESNR